MLPTRNAESASVSTMYHGQQLHGWAARSLHRANLCESPAPGQDSSRHGVRSALRQARRLWDSTLRYHAIDANFLLSSMVPRWFQPFDQALLHSKGRHVAKQDIADLKEVRKLREATEEGGGGGATRVGALFWIPCGH